VEEISGGALFFSEPAAPIAMSLSAADCDPEATQQN
jgi:hypothetical protein